VMPGPDEVEQLIVGDHGVRGDLRAHQLTIPSQPVGPSTGEQAQAREWCDRG
jgi:hypothetical protein